MQIRQIPIRHSILSLWGDMEKFAMRPIFACEIGMVWDIVGPLLEKSIDYSDKRYTVDDIKRDIKSKDMQLWVVVDSAGNIHSTIVTRVVIYPQRKVLFLEHIAGSDFDEWKHLLHVFVAFAQRKGCSSIDAFGRPGWEKKIAPLGFKKRQVIYRLPLEGITNGERVGNGASPQDS